MIFETQFDTYAARLRALQFRTPEDPRADQILRDDESRRAADAAIAEVDRLSALIDREVPIRTRLQSLADVAQAAGVRVSIELHRRPEAPR